MVTAKKLTGMVSIAITSLLLLVSTVSAVSAYAAEDHYLEGYKIGYEDGQHHDVNIEIKNKLGESSE